MCFFIHVQASNNSDLTNEEKKLLLLLKHRLKNLKNIIKKNKFTPIFITQIKFNGLSEKNLFLVNKELKIFFPEFKLTYNINKKRQMLIDSWPSLLNQKAAENDWAWNAKYDFKTGIKFLIPKIKEFYK